MRHCVLSVMIDLLLPTTAPAKTIADTLGDRGLGAALALADAAPQGRNSERAALMVLRAVERATHTAWQG